MPDTATILGAAKLTGRMGDFSVGGLTAVTAQEEAPDRRATRASTSARRWSSR